MRLCTNWIPGTQRDDINQAHLLSIWTAKRVPVRRPFFSVSSLKIHLYFQLALFVVCISLATALNTLLDRLNGSSVTCASIWASHMDRRQEAIIDGALVFYFIVGVFLDVVETVRKLHFLPLLQQLTKAFFFSLLDSYCHSEASIPSFTAVVFACKTIISR